MIVPMALAVVAATNPAVCSAAPSFAAVAPTRAPARAPVEAFNYDRFGEVHLYRGRGHIRDVVLFVSGEGGWDSGTASLAQRLADRGVLVAGIDFPHYRQQLEKAAQECVSPAPDFENLSHYLQSTLGLKKYLQPILVGYASGATLVYATLAEAPEGLFKSALSIGFTPELPLKRALCESPNLHATPRWDAKGVLQGMTLSPARELPAKWISLQSSQEPASSAPALRNFAAGWPGSEVVSLGPVGRDYPIEERWMPQFDAAFGRLAASRSEAKVAALPAPVADLPLIIVPAAAGGLGNWFAVFLTGDGGWVGLDKGVSAELAKHGMPIVGWDSLKYFWSRRTPDGASRDLDRVLHYYSGAWGRSHALLIGYSQGADTRPFMVNRLPAATRELVAFTTLMGISDNALFEFHVATWLGSPAKGIPTAPELAHWQGSPYLCLYGESDGDSACAELTGHGGSALKMSGGHHFGGGYTQVADAILSRLPATP
ncbi:MAG: hypothetical protein QOD56_3198 [Gammaproteobacteria bacterium]|nr:hypothetical protein [Gammaproteobacteria bacterium]